MNKLAAVTLGACLIGSVAPVFADDQTSVNLTMPALGSQFSVLGYVNQPVISLTNEQLSKFRGENALDLSWEDIGQLIDNLPAIWAAMQNMPY